MSFEATMSDYIDSRDMQGNEEKCMSSETFMPFHKCILLKPSASNFNFVVISDCDLQL